MDVPNSVQSCGGIRIRLTCIIPYKSCPLFALCSNPANCRLCPSTFLISGRVLFPSLPPPRLPWPGHVWLLRASDHYTHTKNSQTTYCWVFNSSSRRFVGVWDEGGNVSISALLSSEISNSMQFSEHLGRWHFQFHTYLLKISISFQKLPLQFDFSWNFHLVEQSELQCYSTKEIWTLFPTTWCVCSEISKTWKWSKNNHGIYWRKRNKVINTSPFCVSSSKTAWKPKHDHDQISEQQDIRHNMQHFSIKTHKTTRPFHVALVELCTF